jgi:hypothetical protein
MKTCSKCLLEKDVREFHKDKSTKSGYSSACAKCKNLQKRVSQALAKPIFEQTSVGKVSIQKKASFQELIDSLSEIYDACIVITRQKDGKAFLNILSNPSHKARADNLSKLEELMTRMVPEPPQLPHNQRNPTLGYNSTLKNSDAS